MYSGAHILTCVIIKILESKGLNLKLPLALVLNYPALDFNFTSWMSKDHLKVLRAEDASGYLSSGGRIDDMRVSEHEDYMHFNTLSMVGSDSRENRRGRSRSLSSTGGMRRNQSWIATLKDFAVGDRTDGQQSPVAEGSNSPRRLRFKRSAPSLKGSNDGVATATQRTLGFTPLESEIKPSRVARPLARSKTLPESQPNITTAGHGGNLSKRREGDEPSEAGNPGNSTVSHIRFSDTRSGNLFSGQEENPGASIGRGRLTMTSRTGYFQDRIIPPSMVGFFSAFSRHSSPWNWFTDRFMGQMRAMAILYLSNRNPDFSTDYQVSPIMTPGEVLARFPRVLMQCGEKDPFVDDTIIFAGRLRESKRARLRELCTKMEKEECSEAEMDEWARLNGESEDDWVEMALFPEWSHGYLQMGRLMKEAKAVIDDIGVWIGEVFESNKAAGVSQSNGDHSHKPNVGGDSMASDAGGGEADSGIGSPSALSTSNSTGSSGNLSTSHQQQQQQLLKTITERELIRRRRLLAAQ